MLVSWKRGIVLNWKKLPLRGIDIDFHRARNIKHKGEYCVYLEKAVFNCSWNHKPNFFKTKQEAIDFIAKKLAEQDWTD